MKSIKNYLATIAALLYSLTVSAHECEVDGIYYNLNTSEKIAKVTYRGNLYSDSKGYFGHVVIPESFSFEGITYNVTHIGENAFYCCSDLTSISIPNSITCVEQDAFAYCTGLTSINIPNSVTYIGQSAFSGCSSLISATIGNGVTSIGEWIFDSCSALTSIIIDKDNKVYDSRYNCNALIETATNTLLQGCQTTVIPNDVTSIGNYAFQGRTSLTSITIGNSVTSIGDWAFYGCTGLSSITIPCSVTRIGLSAFYYCSELLSITIPNSLKYIGDFSFYGCTKLSFITSFATTPPSCGSNTFIEVDKSIPLYVPTSSIETYQTDCVWNQFSNIFPLKIITLQDSITSFTQEENEFFNEINYIDTLPNMTWNALYIPFEIPMNILSDNYDIAYINNVHSYDYEEDGSIDEMVMEIIKIKEGTLHANFPYLIRAKNAEACKVEIKVTNDTLYASEENSITCSSAFMNYEVKGSYTRRDAAELEGSLAINITGKWETLASGTALNPFRLYLKMTAKEGSPVKVNTAALKSIRMRVLGEDDEEGTTAIENVVNKKTIADNAFYDLQGRRVMTPVKGRLYISNGKKVFIKM